MTADITHAEAKALLNAAHDGELDAMTQMRVEAHLAGCPDCTAEYARLSALSTAIRERATRHKAPDALRDALLAMAVEQPAQSAPPSNVVPLRRPNRWLRPASGGFALGAALAASVAVLIDTRGVDDTLTDTIVAAHVRGLQPGHLTDVQISDQHQVKPWFDGKVDFAPPVKDLTAQGFDLVGGRLDYFRGRPAAVVVYRHKLHLIDLFVARADGNADLTAHATPSGYNVEHWTDGGQEYWAVSDLSQAGLKEFAEAVRQ
jgi:anti-sigma factor RsiW